MPTSVRLALLGAGSALLLACGKDAGPNTTTSSAAPPPPRPTATAAPTPPPATTTATAAATAAPGAGGACSIVGDWTGTYPPGPYPFSGTPFDISFKGDGAGLTKSQRADNEFAWTVEGGTLAFHGVKTIKGGRFTCAKEEVGKYAVSFTPDCGSVTVKLQQDPCKGRARTMDGITVKRK